jgi:hypothetical protein
MKLNNDYKDLPIISKTETKVIALLTGNMKGKYGLQSYTETTKVA